MNIAAPPMRNDIAKPIPDPCLVTVIVPVYNERATVAEALDRVLAKRIEGVAFQVVVVESGSEDGSREIVRGFEGRPGIDLVFEERARGKGHAVRAGLAKARGDIVLIQDADLEYEVSDYDALLEPIRRGRASFTLGSRHGRQTWKIRKFDDQPLRAMVLNGAHWMFTALIDVSLGLRLRDPFTMYKVFRRDCLDGLTLRCNRFDFDWELLIKLVRAGHEPLEIPVNYRSRSFGEGKKIRIVRDPLTWIVAWARARFGPL